MRRPFPFLRVLMIFFLSVLSCSPLAAATADEYYQAGLSLYSQKNYPQAIPYLKAAIQLNPNHWQAYQLMGYCYYQTLDNAGALDVFDKSIAINPENLELKIYADNLRARTGISPSIPAAASAGVVGSRAPTPKEARAFEKNKWLQLHLSGIFASLGDLKAGADAFPALFDPDVTTEAKMDGLGFLIGLEGGYAFNPENSIGLSIDAGVFGGVYRHRDRWRP
jgi:tetratricopeptide (TPR) repeat protein